MVVGRARSPVILAPVLDCGSLRSSSTGCGSLRLSSECARRDIAAVALDAFLAEGASKAMSEQRSVVDFYTEIVLPGARRAPRHSVPRVRLASRRARLDRDERGEHASRLGVRAERVVAHGPAPRGFLVHGGEPTLWTAYVSGGVRPARRGVRSRRQGPRGSRRRRPRADRATRRRATAAPTCCTTSSTSAGASWPAKAAPRRARTSSGAASQRTRSNARVSASSLPGEVAQRSTGGWVLGARRSQPPASSPTRAGRGRICGAWRDEAGQDRHALGAGARRASRGRDAATSTSAARAERSPALRALRGARNATVRASASSFSSRASSTSINSARAESRTSPHSAERRPSRRTFERLAGSASSA